MAATATASAGVRYAPEDPTLPKPWKGLVDGSTGYLYFWNPETNSTQYERPTGPAHSSKSSSVSIGSSVQAQHSSQRERHSYNFEKEDGLGGGSNFEPKVEVGMELRNQQVHHYTSYSVVSIAMSL